MKPASLSRPAGEEVSTTLTDRQIFCFSEKELTIPFEIKETIKAHPQKT